MSHYFRQHKILTLILVIVIFITSYRWLQNSSGGMLQQAVPVVITHVKLENFKVNLKVIGSVQAFSTVAVKSQVDGILQHVAFEEGQDVKVGDTLFTIDSRAFQVQLQQAQANLARDQAQLINTQASLERDKQLLQKHFVAKSDYDTAQAAAASAAATVKADQAAVANAQLQLNYCTIKSPINGRTGSLLLHEGNLVKANDTNALVVINQITPILISFSIPENDLSQLRRLLNHGSVPVMATLPNDSSFKEVGELSFTDNAVDTNTGMVLAKARFQNNDRQLWPGQFVNISLSLNTLMNALVIPAQAVQQGQNGSYVYIINAKNIAEYRAINVAATANDETAVASGLTEGEQVVTEGQFRLTNGLTVKLKA